MMRLPYLQRTAGLQLTAVLASLCCAQAQAQVGAASEAMQTYTVQAGDTLSQLVAKHLQGHDALAQVLRINALNDPDRLLTGQSLRLPKRLIRQRVPEALVTGLGCNDAMRQRDGQSQRLRMGDAVREGDLLSTPTGCQLALTLDDASSLRLLSGTVTRIKTLKANSLQPPQLELELQEGRVEGQVPRKRAKDEPSFEIRTSVSLAGIRGTEFRVGFNGQTRNSQLEVLSGRVAALGSADRNETLVKAQQGLSIPASGRALPVETLPPVAQLLESLAAPGERAYTLRLRADAEAAQRRVVWTQEANATRLSAESLWPGAEIPVAVQDGEASFLRVSGLTASGLEGQGTTFGVCQGYRLQQSLRCDVRFDLAGWSRSQLRLTRMAQQPHVVVDAEVPGGTNDQAVLHGLPEGQYHWALNQVLPSGASVQSEGRFQLVVLSDKR